MGDINLIRWPQPGGGDPDAAREYRQAIQRRFTELVAEHRAKPAELAQLAEHQDQPGPPDPGLLAADGPDHVNGTVAAITSQQNAETVPLLWAPPAGRPQQGKVR